ncbi:Clp protease N-terminal domain-containing protein [Micromonospora sp. NPDC047812]|uniref:Clp protease N-terminal domain-containing protein n=1 Tax=Micromonospora sp. NPDC047812 TaxID=3155742 RepID=UPI003454CA6A
MKLPGAIQDVRTIKALLTGAETEARRAGDDLPGPEHLLLSAFGLPDGTARRAFERLGADPDDFRAAVDTAHRQALHDVGVTMPNGAEQQLPPPTRPGGVYRMTAPGQEAFQAAVKLSKATKPSLLRGGHVVAAVCDQEHGTVARALKALGIERGALAIAAGEALANR